MEQFDCRYCGAGFGIAGSLATDEDWEAQEFFELEVEYHEDGACLPQVIAERIETGVALGRSLRAVGATPAEVVQALAPIAASVGELREMAATS